MFVDALWMFWNVLKPNQKSSEIIKYKNIHCWPMLDKCWISSHCGHLNGGFWNAKPGRLSSQLKPLARERSNVAIGHGLLRFLVVLYMWMLYTWCYLLIIGYNCMHLVMFWCPSDQSHLHSCGDLWFCSIAIQGELQVAWPHHLKRTWQTTTTSSTCSRKCECSMLSGNKKVKGWAPSVKGKGKQHPEFPHVTVNTPAIQC